MCFIMKKIQVWGRGTREEKDHFVLCLIKKKHDKISWIVNFQLKNKMLKDNSWSIDSFSKKLL